MKTVSKAIGTREGVLGEVSFPVYEDLAEMTDTYGDDGVFKLAARALAIDLERVARDNLKGGKTLEEAQALVDSYKPGGGRGDKPTMNNFLNLLNKFGEAKRIDEMLEAQRLFKEESLESAYAYLKDKE